jgi:hypothetical protein
MSDVPDVAEILPGDKTAVDHLTPADGWSDDNGCEKCPVCSMIYSGNGGYTGEVFETDGTEHESIADADPADGPFLCPPCWDELENAVLADEHRTLDSFADAK